MRNRQSPIFFAATGILLAAHVQVNSQIDSNSRQLTYDGLRSGEGYFSADGSKMVFQSEREAGNPFYQIYLMDLKLGDVERVSPGVGKTTCAWIHPDGNRVMFASTHDDTDAAKKQQTTLDERANGKAKRYAWDYDEHYDIYEKNLKSGKLRKLTEIQGYDAEGSYSPDGKKIAFASNRWAYSTNLDESTTKRFGIDKSYLMDIYIADADGSNPKRLTEAVGYDGGPFFSADGKKICWRRFSPDGHTAEIWTMNIDGSDKLQLTRIGAMSWAPYFHPSGEYLIFTTNKHGFDNFELYLVDAKGQREPVRVTDRAGFDGLPAFSPDGKRISWTSNATSKKQSQIFIADWDHAAALKLLETGNIVVDTPADAPPTKLVAGDTEDAITEADARRQVSVLASEWTAGRMTGEPGEQRATQFVAGEFKKHSLESAGVRDTYFDPFVFTAGVSLGKGNELITLKPLQVRYGERAWRPLAFSKTGRFKSPQQIAFVGYGIVAPGNPEKDIDEYDSYVHTDVKGKWVMMFRYMPEDVPPATRQHWSRYAGIRYKAMVARDKGAAGIIFVSGPTSKVKQHLIPLGTDASMGRTSIGAISINDHLADKWLKTAEKDLKKTQTTLDKGVPMMGFDLPGVEFGVKIDITQQKRTGRNVVARLQAGDKPSKEFVLIGAHIDHLGTGKASGSLDPNVAEDAIHYGADDNASGIAALLEIAEYLTDLKSRGKLKMKRDIVFAAWSGEELGLLGSHHFAEQHSKNPHAPKIAAYLNMDMIGRYRDNLILQGIGSSGVWRRVIEKANVPIGLKLTLADDAYLPTDSTAFYVRDIPILNAFTGAHEDYHKPSDTADKINYADLARITKFMALVTRQLAIADDAPDYIAMKKPRDGERRGGLRAYLGTVPDYAQGENAKGLKLSGVAQNGPAAKAGLLGGDVIVELAGRKIENIYDYTYAIDALKIGTAVKVVVTRKGERKAFEITPGSRD